MAQAPRPSNGFKNKQNVNPSLDRNTEASAEDFQEAASLFEWFADWVDNQVQPEKFYQFHTSLPNLAAAHPNAEEDGWAIIVPDNGNTPFVATFTDGEWVASQVEPPVQFFDTKIARDQAGDGQEGIFYIIKDAKLISLWYNNKYNDFGKDGNNGLDAYQVALAFGFEGSEQEWLESLKGKSAYQSAVDNGFEGTEAEWIESLGGIPGKSAYQVWLDAGNQGTEADFFLSITGPDGKSVYQTWLDEGNQGTEADFLASLEGDPGDPGKSTYQIWLDAGNQGTEADFLLSIKGEPGAGFENIPAEANKIPVTDGEGGINWEEKSSDPGTGGSGMGNIDFGLTGAIDGTNKVFQTSAEFPAGKVLIFLNGIAQTLGDDYTESTTQIIEFIEAPHQGDKLIAVY